MLRGDRSVRFIVGKRGSGKTVLARNLVTRLDCRRIVYYDSNGHDYSGGVICNGLDQLKTYWRRVIGGNYQIVYRSINPRADFDTVCRLVMAAGNTVFVVDEVDMYFDNEGNPGEAFADVIRRGRHEDIELIGITQRPRKMGEVRSMAEYLYIFETHEPSDLSYFKQSFSESLIDKIKALQKYQYVQCGLPYDETGLCICRENEPENSIRTEMD